jgi:hypothetical protein
MRSLPFRHVCLDFHTSPLIPDIGKDFDSERFVATLTAAHVNWITLPKPPRNCYCTKVGRMHLLVRPVRAMRRRVTAASGNTTVDGTWAEAAGDRLKYSRDGRWAGSQDLEGR